MTREEIATRKPVWLALSDLYLDTDVSLSYQYIARILAESPYSIEELEEILRTEVAPVVAPNLFSVAGEWAGFDEQWLISRILEKGKSRAAYVPARDWAAVVALLEGMRRNAVR